MYRSIRPRHNIHTLHEERKNKQLNLSSLCLEHKDLIFLGYAFHASNNEILGFSLRNIDSESQNKIFPGKTIKYLNFDGEGTYPDKEFASIKENCKIIGRKIKDGLNIQVSYAKKISDAYYKHLKPF